MKKQLLVMLCTLSLVTLHSKSNCMELASASELQQASPSAIEAASATNYEMEIASADTLEIASATPIVR